MSEQHRSGCGFGFVDLKHLGIPGYCIADTGEVWSRIEGAHVIFGDTMRPAGLSLWKRMKPVRRGSDYLAVSLNRKSYYVHVLVLTAFVGPRPAGMVGCHSDGNHLNNSLANLRWDTPLANYRDGLKHGRMRHGDRHPMAKINARIAEAIRAEYARGDISQSKLGKKYGVTQTLVGQIVRGAAWKVA